MRLCRSVSGDAAAGLLSEKFPHWRCLVLSISLVMKSAESLGALWGKTNDLTENEAACSECSGLRFSDRTGQFGQAFLSRLMRGVERQYPSISQNRRICMAHMEIALRKTEQGSG